MCKCHRRSRSRGSTHTAVGGEAKAQNLGGLFGIGNGDPNVCQEIPPMKMSAAKTRSLGGCVTCPLLIDWSKFINRYDRQYGKVSVILYSALLVLLNVAPRLQYCFMRGINYVVENPVSSLLWRYRCVREPYPEVGTFFLFHSSAHSIWIHSIRCAHFQKEINDQPACGTEKLLRKHRARRISISLGAYGAHSAKQVAFVLRN